MEGDPDEADVPWLRDMADEDLLVLFSDDRRVLRRAVRGLIAQASEDSDLESRLIDLLELSAEHRNDDSSASVCTAIILGEIGSTRALAVLQRALALDAEEEIQEAAQAALLRMGAPAIDAVLLTLEETDDPAFAGPAYEVLGMTGSLGDEELCGRVKAFLEERVEAERRKPRGERAIEHVFRASARLGDRRQIEAMRRVLGEDYGGRSSAIEDSIEMLEENAAGVPIAGDVPPWEERFGWLLGDEREEARVERAGGRLAEGDMDDDDDEETAGAEAAGEPWRRREVSLLFRGLSVDQEAGGTAEEEDSDRAGEEEDDDPPG